MALAAAPPASKKQEPLSTDFSASSDGQTEAALSALDDGYFETLLFGNSCPEFIRDDMDEHLAAQLMQDLQVFHDAYSSLGKPAVLTLMGDSTMVGLNFPLMQMLTKRIEDHYRMTIRLDCDPQQKTDGACKPKSLNAIDIYPDLKKTATEDQFNAISAVTARLNAAAASLPKDQVFFFKPTNKTRESHWGGGFYSTIFFGPFQNGIVVNLWAFTPELARNCWHPKFTRALSALSTDAVVWNIGLHLMHLHPARTCKPTDPAEETYWNCQAQYDEVVEDTLKQLMTVADFAIFKTTNYICERNFITKWTSAVMSWSSSEAAMEAQCQADCHLDQTGRSCKDELMTAHGATVQHDLGMEAWKRVRNDEKQKLAVLDAFNETVGQCDDAPDGRHFKNANFRLLRQMMEMLRRRAVSKK